MRAVVATVSDAIGNLTEWLASGNRLQELPLFGDTESLAGAPRGDASDVEANSTVFVAAWKMAKFQSKPAWHARCTVTRRRDHPRWHSDVQ